MFRFYFIGALFIIPLLQIIAALECYRCNSEIPPRTLHKDGSFAICNENLTDSNVWDCPQADPVCVFLLLQGPLTGEVRRSCIDSTFDCSTYVYPVPDVEIKDCYTCNTTKCNDRVID